MISFNSWCIGLEALKQEKKQANVKTEFIRLINSSIDTNLGSNLVKQKPISKNKSR